MFGRRRGRFSLLFIWAAAIVLAGCSPLGSPGTTAGLPIDSPDVAPPIHRADPPNYADADVPATDDDPTEQVDAPTEPIKAHLAIVLDDLGWGQAGSDELLAFPRPLTFAILPRSPLADEVVTVAQKNGHTILLHLPMEPLNRQNNDPGPDAIYVDMTEAEIKEKTAALLDELHEVVGVNNHMGSAATADARVMSAVLGVIKERNLFFLDSATTAASVVSEEAERLGVRYAVNSLFLDLERTVPAVKEMVREAMRQAEAKGSYIAIAHPHPSVATALYEMIPELDAAGIALVPVTELVRVPE